MRPWAAEPRRTRALGATQARQQAARTRQRAALPPHSREARDRPSAGPRCREQPRTPVPAAAAAACLAQARARRRRGHNVGAAATIAATLRARGPRQPRTRRWLHPRSARSPVQTRQARVRASLQTSSRSCARSERHTRGSKRSHRMVDLTMRSLR
eukprot:6030065-Pleurochrysis_carterae.AAC.1